MPELPYAPDERLTATRAHFGLSQREAARLLGTTQAHVNHAESGRRPLPYAVGLRLRALHALVQAAPAGPPAPAPSEADDLGLALGRLADCDQRNPQCGCRQQAPAAWAGPVVFHAFCGHLVSCSCILVSRAWASVERITKRFKIQEQCSS